MAEAIIPPRSSWQTLWRRIPLTAKAVLVAIFLGILFWVSTDVWQTTQVRTILRQKRLEELNIQARRDRILFNDYVLQQEQAVRMLSYFAPLVHYVEATAAHWETDPAPITRWSRTNRPPWLPPRSVIRGLIAAPYMLLLDDKKRLRELFIREEGLLDPPGTYRDHALADLLTLDERSHIVANDHGILYLITATGIEDARTTAHPKAFLVLVAPLDDHFLSVFYSKTERNSAVALIHGETNQVFASSQPDLIKTGMTVDQLTPHYMIFGKKFLDYNFAIDIPIHFATLVSLEEIARISDTIVDAERRQRAIGYVLLATVFLTLVYSVARSVQRFTENMVKTAIEQLDLEKQSVESGDQLLIMEEQFHWMTNEILHSRYREKARRLELQATNEALQKTLVMVKQTQSQLVEAEKMASLGSLVAGVAHEINTPVGTGVTAASFLERKSRECAAQLADGSLRKSELESFFRDVIESTQMIFHNLNRAAELVRSFKQVAVDRTNEERRTFRLHEYIDHILLSLRPRLKKTQHTVTVECPETLEIDSYPGAFSQIISNLIVNSLLHGFQEHEAGKILFQVTRREGDILFCYSDNGRGMEEKDRLRVFEPFFTTARHRGGSGLGLHIVFNLVTQSLGGTICCISSPGQGTRYEISIPTKPLAEEA
ncbi:MAG: HAMP domain-containing histidine kinase [Magnetococcales bacterium]|nr:HAMP domain-containing histidine kinase [Magnetococcales bacterium]